MAKEMSLEAALKRLDEINALLENGELNLDDSLKLYEEGIKLAAFCYQRLDKAELKIKEITAAAFGQKEEKAE